MKEQVLQTKVIKKLQTEGAYVVKTISTNHAGVPDLLVCLRGQFLGLEIKAGRIFQEKLNHFELEMLEPVLNAMLETGKRNMDAADWLS